MADRVREVPALGQRTVDASSGRDVRGEPVRVPLADVARGAVEVELSRAADAEIDETDDETDDEG